MEVQEITSQQDQCKMIEDYLIEEGDPIQCPICWETLESPDFLEVHEHLHSTNVGKCPYCKKTYQVQKFYREHIEWHMKNNFICEFCQKVFFMKRPYTTHVAQHKRDRFVFVCEDCNMSFPTRKQMVRHEAVHSNERPFKCDKCDKSFKRFSTLQSHMNTHAEEKNFICGLCNGAFATASSVRRHIKRIHETGRSIECKLCQEEFLNLDSFSKHRMDKHPDVERFFKICPICQEEFVSKTRYYDHNKIHQEKGELSKNMFESNWKVDIFSGENTYSAFKQSKGDITCCLCGESVDIKTYPSHQNDHLGMTAEEVRECKKISKFTCKECGATTSLKSSAIFHVNLHLEKKYRCEVKGCKRNVPFTYLSYTKHHRKHHLKYACKFCKTSLSGRLEVRRHLKHNCAGSKKLREKRKVYICKWCKSTFTSSIFLMRHHSTHKRLSVLYCQLCKKQFPRISHYRKHMFVVHDKNITDKNTSVYQVPQDEITPAEEVPKNKFYCALCKKSFHSRKIFVHHEKAHFKMECKRCKKVFMHQKQYSYHIRNKLCSTQLANAMIAELNDFKCKLCPDELTNRRDFIQHILNAHSIGDYHCKYCIARFTSLEKFRTHLVARHPTEKKYFCATCNAKGFVTFAEFMAHKLWHKKENHFVEEIVTVDEIVSRIKTEVKEEILSDEEVEAVDFPEEVKIDANEQVQEV